MMSNKFKRSYSLIALMIPMLYACGNGEDAFTPFNGTSSTNIISDLHFSVGVNPLDPAVIDDDGTHGNVEVSVIVMAGDRNNAAVTTGTVQIRTECGLLSAPSCQLNSSGTCSVSWYSELDCIPSDYQNQIVAYTTGEESYIDHDGSGTYNNAIDTLYADESEPFIDRAPTRNGIFNIAEDQLIPNTGNGNAVHDDPFDPGFNGANCVSGCATSTLTTIWDSVLMNLDQRTPPTP
ncbi:MAG TPA: hypothetical protein VIQ03_07985 [Gammaproteobacteria bacterium]